MVLEMASKANKPAAAKLVKPAAPKTAIAEALVAAEAVADVELPSADPLVTNIVSVEPTPIAQGVNEMTDTVNPTVETATEETAAKANAFFADVREKATDAADKGKKLAADAVEFNKANVEAMIEAAKIAAQGAQDLGKTNVEFAKSNFEDMQVAFKEMTAVKSPTDFVKLQSEYARKGFDTAVAQASKNTEAMVKLVSDMFQPISNRAAVATELFKKAA